MINKYFLYKKLLSDDDMTRDLDRENNPLEEMFGIVTTDEDRYKSRVSNIKTLISLPYLENLVNVSGPEIAAIILQRDAILDKLDNIPYVTLLTETGHNFKYILESLLEVTLEHIKNYEAAEKLLSGERVVTVIVDGNRHEFTVDGKRTGIRTTITDNTVTLEKCQEVTNNIRKNLNYDPEELEFMLSIYTQTQGNEYGGFPEECLLDREVRYYPRTNCMLVYEKGHPVYENCNGEICTVHTRN